MPLFISCYCKCPQDLLVVFAELPFPVQLGEQKVFLPVGVEEPAASLFTERLPGYVVEDGLCQVSLQHLRRTRVVRPQPLLGHVCLPVKLAEPELLFDVILPWPGWRLDQARGGNDAGMAEDDDPGVVTTLVLVERPEQLVDHY